MNKIENFKEFKQLKLETIITIPQELNYLFLLCKNEILISNNNLIIISLYSKILLDCLLQYNNLTYNNVNIIQCTQFITKSNSEKESLLQYKKITKPTHILPSLLLKMINDYKKLYFINPKLQKFKVFDILLTLIKEILTDKQHHSPTRKKQLLNAKISYD